MIPRSSVARQRTVAIIHQCEEHNTNNRIGSPRELERWLVDAGLAARDGGLGLLVPTALGLELGAALALAE